MKPFISDQLVPPSVRSFNSLDDAVAALALVSEAGEAIRKLEHDSQEAVARAQSAVVKVKEKLDQTLSRAERAETALQGSELQIRELSSALERANEEIAQFQSQLALLEQRLAQTIQRAEMAELQAEDANKSIQRIVLAIRTELPVGATAGQI